MYDGRFKKARDWDGNFYRNSKTGDLDEYCMHSYKVFPEYETVEEVYCGIKESKEQFMGFRGVCYFCGDVIHIDREDVFADYEALEKELKPRLEEIEKKDKRKIRRDR